MSWNIWLPFWINLGLLACAIAVVMLLHETHKPSLGKAVPSRRSADTDIEEADPLLAESERSPSRYASAFQKPQGFAQETTHAAQKLKGLVQGRRDFQVLLCSFFLTALASSDTKLLVQYISKRYEWTFAQVSLSY